MIVESGLSIINEDLLNHQLHRVESKKKQFNLYKYSKRIINTFIINNSYLLSEKKLYRTSVENINKIKDLLIKFNIDAIFINSDRKLKEDLYFVKAAKNLNIKTIIPYMVYFAEKEGLLKTSFVEKKEGYFISRYILKAQKRFIHHTRENKYYYPQVLANVLKSIGVLPENPWFMGGGKSDILCLPNQYMKEHYIKNGVREEKIKVVGDIAYDTLYFSCNNKENIRERISDDYLLDEKQEIIIVALPQLGEHNILPWDIHWQEIEFLMNTLLQLEKNILISLHPKMNRNDYMYLEKKYKCHILDEKLSTVLPIADLFIATFSSTVLWSVLLGVKTIVIDFYGLNYTMYDFLLSIKKVDEKKLLSDSLKESLTSSVDFTEDWKNLSKDKVFDGKTIMRYAQLIDKKEDNNEFIS